MRLGWVRDVGALLAQHPELDFEKILAWARAGGYLRVILLSLVAARDGASVRLPDPVCRAVDADRAVAGLWQEVLGSVLDIARPEPRNDRIDRFRWTMRERWRDRISYGMLTLCSPRRHHVELVALPRALSWGYYAIKRGIDFALRPLWAALGALKGR